LYTLRPISADGSRVFFESFEALVPRDVNDTWDVYQWEAPGAGTCTAADPTYGEASGGCVDLISAGEGASPSKLLDADAEGESAFIATRDRLVPGDEDDLVDVYAVRAAGGFPAPAPPAAPCEGEGCRGASPADPGSEGAGSSRFESDGNPDFPPPDTCAPTARRAKAASRAAKRLRSRAAKVSRAATRARNPRRARSLRRGARRYAKQARGKAKVAKRARAKAKRCRRARQGANR
jgi:hypothetical protein